MRCSRPISAALAVALCLAAAWGAAPCATAQGPLRVTRASIGFGGKYKSGFWNPVIVSLQAGDRGAAGELELVVPDGDHVPVIFADETAGRIDLAPGQQTTVMLYAKTGPIAAPVTLRLHGEGGEIWSHDLSGLVTPAQLATQELVVGIGPDVGLSSAEGLIKRRNDLTLVTAQVDSAADLPDAWWAYEGVDVVVLSTSDRDLVNGMSAKQREALLDWVRLGGRIALCVGARGEELLAAGSPWAEIVPGKLADVAPFRDGSGLRTFTASDLPISDEAFPRSRPLATRLTLARGKVLVEEGGAISANRPLVVHAPYGFGQVVFVGLDLDHPSLAAWKGRPQLWARLLQSERAQREASDGESRRSVTHLGYEDLSGQLRAALDQFPGVTLVNFTTVSILTIVYLLLVGPGDYLLFSRLGWPRHWTWLTFPFVATLLGGLAWALAGQSHGQRVRVNQAEIIDLDWETGTLRGTAWSHVYSPTTAHFHPALEISSAVETAAEPQGWLIWQGLPGESLGGLSSRQVQLAAAEPYRAELPDDKLKLSGLPVPAASSKSLTARWWADAEVPGEVRLGENQFGVLTGEFPFPLPVELSDCLMIYGEKLYRLDKLIPGQTVHMEDYTPLNLEARLTQRTVVQSKDASTPWKRDSIEVPRIVLMMMFHEAARGSSYTGLTNRFPPTIDLTDQVRVGRAVLTGRSKQSVSRLVQRDEPLAAGAELQSWTWYRIVLPVGAQTSPPPPSTP
jgi:hypothetical protein